MTNNPTTRKKSPSPATLKPKSTRSASRDALLRLVIISAELEKHPEHLWLVPKDLRPRLVDCQPSAWVHLLCRKPELFRNMPFRGMEDVAFDFLLGKLFMAKNSNGEHCIREAASP
jgi:hypothetical protein